MKKLVLIALISSLASCGSSSDGGGGAPAKITVNASASAYAEDSDANDNLTLVETECDLVSAQAKVKLFYTSELLGAGHFVESELYLPSSEKWTDNKYTRADNSDGCNAPGYRAIIASDLATAKTNFLSGMKYLYGCGATCDYTLKSKTLNANGYYESFSVEWSCTSVQVTSLSSQGNFGSTIDKTVGSATCQ